MKSLPDQPGPSVKVNIMQREFTVVCTDESEIEGLIEAAAYLDKQIRSIAGKRQIMGQDRCAVMAGLNISYEFLQLQKTVDSQYTDNARLDALRERIDKAVDKFDKISL